MAVFKGIPFAEPPVRFAAPQRVEAWDGTRDALSYGPPPPQSGLFGLDRYEAEARAAGLAERTVVTYVDRARRFVRWLDGDYSFPDHAGRAVANLRK